MYIATVSSVTDYRKEHEVSIDTLEIFFTKKDAMKHIVATICKNGLRYILGLKNFLNIDKMLNNYIENFKYKEIDTESLLRYIEIYLNECEIGHIDEYENLSEEQYILIYDEIKIYIENLIGKLENEELKIIFNENFNENLDIILPNGYYVHAPIVWEIKEI